MLELDGVTRRFGEVTALDGLSFSIRPGLLTGFVGANGAGKTTAMRIMMGIDSPDTGEVRWRGSPVGHDVRRVFGYMPEERGLYPKMRVRDQLIYLATLHGIRRNDAARSATAWLDRLGLAGRVEDRLEQLSLGNQQRVQLVAALIHDPELLVLDEPFSGIDPVALDTMSAVVVEYAHERGVPVVFSSHQLELVERICDHVAIIDDGRLVAAGGVDELQQQGRRRDRRLRVEIADCRNPFWADDLAGVRLLDRDEHAGIVRTLLQVEDPSTTAKTREAVLDAGRGAGALVAFEDVRPSLTDLYREAVTRDDADATAMVGDGA